MRSREGGRYIRIGAGIQEGSKSQDNRDGEWEKEDRKEGRKEKTIGERKTEVRKKRNRNLWTQWQRGKVKKEKGLTREAEAQGRKGGITE